MQDMARQGKGSAATDASDFRPVRLAGIIEQAKPRLDRTNRRSENFLKCREWTGVAEPQLGLRATICTGRIRPPSRARSVLSWSCRNSGPNRTCTPSEGKPYASIFFRNAICDGKLASV
jgi:hypothetical protein